MKTRFLLVALAGLAVGCAETMHSQYSEPYVQFASEPGQFLKELLPATVTKIDGKDVTPGAIPPAKPGRHTVEVAFARAPGGSASIARTIEIEAKPCVRYNLALRHAPPTEYEAIVSSTERIGECERLASAKSAGM